MPPIQLSYITDHKAVKIIMRSNRLNTEQLIQSTRNNYDMTKLQEKNKELETTLQLRNKESQYLTSQVASVKEQYTLKVKLLQNDLTHLKTQLAQMKFNTVKEKRLESQKHEVELQYLKQHYQNLLAERNQQYQLRITQLTKGQEEQTNSLKQKYEKYLSFQKNQSFMSKESNSQQTANLSVLIGKLEDQHRVELRGKKELQRKVESFKEGIQVLKVDFNRVVTGKEEEIAVQRGEIQGLKFRVKMMEQKIEEQNNQRIQFQTSRALTFEQLKQTNAKMQSEIEKYKQLLRERQDEMLDVIRNSQKGTLDQSIHPVYQCNHQGLIRQMEKNLELKNQQVTTLKKIVEEWTQVIGFDRPVSQRLNELSSTSLTTRDLNQNWINSLAPKSKKGAKVSKMRS